MTSLQSALRGWFGKGRALQHEALELLRQDRMATQERIGGIVSRLDKEDLWFYEQDLDSLECLCHDPSDQSLTTDPSFYVPAGLFLILLALNDYSNFMDGCLLVYVLSMTAAVACACVYAWWWWHTGSATEVYRWVTALFFALVWSDAFILYVRLLYIRGQREAYLSFLESDLWHLRVVPLVIVQIYMAALVVKRLRGGGQ